MIFTSVLQAASPVHWGHLLEMTHRHEFYKNNEVILKPQNSWQHLFTFNYLDREMNRLKDCVFYHVPGVEEGTLKVKALPEEQKCDDYLLKPGDQEWKRIKALQYNVTPKSVAIDISYHDFLSEKWQADFQKSFQKPKLQLNLSSAEYKSPKVILLAPIQNGKSESRPAVMSGNVLCHDINEDCEEKGPSTCDVCPEGWYEIPNGCSVGPKYCGRDQCGRKGQPACRRGMVWQKREEQKFDCRVDSSFVYCAKGLTVNCEGQKAFCR